MNQKNKIILLAYTALLFSGGFIGYIKSHSLMSLIASMTFSIVLMTLYFLDKRIKNVVSYVAFTLVLLDSFFSYRFIKTLKIMPSGIFAIITFLTIVLFIKSSDRIQNKAQRGP